MQTFTKYPDAKRFFTQLSNEGVKVGTALLDDYETLKKIKGELAAARYLLRVYTVFNNYRERDFNNG